MSKNPADYRNSSDTLLLVVGPFAKTTLPLLKGCGFSATLCHGAKEALEMLQGQRPEAVLYDLGMPGGAEFPSQVAAQYSDVALIAVTREGELRGGLLAMMAGASGYIQSPSRPEVVSASLRGALTRKRLECALRGGPGATPKVKKTPRSEPGTATAGKLSIATS